MDKKRIYITGANGMVGSRLIQRGCSPLSADVRDEVVLDKIIQAEKPKLIIHCAAKTNVNYCETSEEVAFETNVCGSQNVFFLAEKYNIPVVMISSDHIFDGKWFGNYKETNENYAPVNYYGFTKFGAEAHGQAFENVKIVRTSTLISKHRASVSEYLIKLRKGQSVNVPIFMWRSFVHINHFVNLLLDYADRYQDMPTVLNLSGSLNVSWWRLIKEYARYEGLDSSLVKPRWTQRDIPGEAKRPQRCGLSTKLSEELGFAQYDYMDAIREDLDCLPQLP